MSSKLDHLADHNCELCPLHEYTERVCVMGRGNPQSRIMILGEAPGANEADTGVVFSGRAGQMLDAALHSAGLSESDPYISNVVKCRPPENRTPERYEWESCADYLLLERGAVDPTHVLLLGNTALRAVAGTSGITKHRGVRLSLRGKLAGDFAGCEVMATIHPAYVLRNPGQSSVFFEDVRRFARMVRGELRSAPVKTVLVNTAKGLRKLREILEAADVIAYDTEDRYAPWHPEWTIVVLGVSVDGQTTYVVPLDHPESPFRDKWRRVLQYLRPALERPGARLVAQNGKHDNVQLAGAKVFVNHAFDIMLAAHLLDENRPKNLGFLSQTLLGADEWKGMVELKPEKIMEQPLRALARYNGYDVGYTYQLRPKLKAELAEHPRLARLFTKLMMPASHVIQKVEYRGMPVDRDRLWDRIEALQKMIEEQVEVIREYGGGDLNPNSPAQLGRWLFGGESDGGLGLSPLEVTARGAPSTRESVLLHYHDHPAVASLLRYRTLQLKWMNTYLLPWSSRMDRKGRIHTNYKLYGTVTGRLSGDMQQVPRDPFIRTVFGSRPGWLFVQADYSQIELRIAAHCANERRMIRAFLTGEDLHSLTAARTIGKPQSELTKDERKKAKAVNFGFLYGMYPKKFKDYAFESYGIEVTIEEAELVREQFFQLYPDLPTWYKRQERIVRSLHQVQSPIGRVRHLPDILSGDQSVQREAIRQAINSPVQSCASDLMLYSMVLLDQRLDAHEAYMVGTLHDGIFFEVKEDAIDRVAPIIKDTMENLPLKKTFGLELNVPIVSEVEWGKHWGEPVDSI